ncbi:MAG TPA: ScpA family protein [Mycobacteriales bacterium]|nr:ScpA family protein [Mycobacteriales bacterium]
MPVAPQTAAAAPAEALESAAPGFEVHLDVFEGPFDLLLSLIAKRRLDVTLVALSQVTDEFVAYIRQQGAEWDLGQASEFLVVAATLLDLKLARLLPSDGLDDEENLALLEARDLLFARLLQYRAYKQITEWFAERLAAGALRHPRTAPLEPGLLDLLPPVELSVGPGGLAALAAAALTRTHPEPVVDIGHLIAPTVSVREQAGLLAARLRRTGASTFRALVMDCPDTAHVVARFLAVLELYREGAVRFDQVEPLGELHIRWLAGDADPTALLSEIAETYEPAAEPAESA